MKKFMAMTLSICLGIFLGTMAFAYEDGDWQFWSSGSIEGHLAESWMLKLEQQFRLGDTMADLYYRNTDIGMTWRVVPWFNWGWNYAQLYQKKKGTWREENRPHVNGTLIWKWYGVKLEDRNRLERRIREKAENIWMYRNRLTLGFSAKLTRLDIQPYLTDEIFVNLDESELYRNRISVGLKGQLRTYLKADISYLWQSSRANENWLDEHVIGLTLGVSM